MCKDIMLSYGGFCAAYGVHRSPGMQNAFSVTKRIPNLGVRQIRQHGIPIEGVNSSAIRRRALVRVCTRAGNAKRQQSCAPKHKPLGAVRAANDNRAKPMSLNAHKRT